MSDFTVQDHGSIMLLEPHTEEARIWVYENLPDDAQTWMNGIVVEPRYMSNILLGIEDAGLEVIY